MSRAAIITSAIESSPYNRGLTGAAWLSNPDNIAVVLGRDVVLFDACADGDYEAHFLCQPGRALASVREAFRQIFEDHSAACVFGLIPIANRKAKLVARWAGARAAGIRQTEFGPCDLFVLPREIWSKQCHS